MSRLEWLQEQYPLWVKIVTSNPYSLPLGKEFRARRKKGDASPFPVEIIGDRVYQMREDEIEELTACNGESIRKHKAEGVKR